MTEADKILRMIETVDPSDTAKLDEIDAMVEWYLGVSKEPMSLGIYRYTRSRDALKAIRPEGWVLSEALRFVGGYKVTLWNKQNNALKTNPNDNLFCATEQLAELHAIIQAIQHERGQA